MYFSTGAILKGKGKSVHQNLNETLSQSLHMSGVRQHLPGEESVYIFSNLVKPQSELVSQ